jgi:hypothetical protein
MPGPMTAITPTSIPGDFPMLKRAFAACARFEDSPAGLILGLIILCLFALLPLALNEGGLR